MSEWTKPDPEDPESIRKHLDELIEYHREKEEEEDTKVRELMARCYIDAYQSIRKNIFGEVLQGDGEDATELPIMAEE